MLCLSFHIVAFSYCSRCLPTVIIPWVADSYMSTPVILGGPALPRPSIVSPSTSRTPRSAIVPNRPGSLWVNKAMVGRTRMGGNLPFLSPKSFLWKLGADEGPIPAFLGAEKWGWRKKTFPQGWKLGVLIEVQPELTLRTLSSNEVSCGVAFFLRGR